MKIVICSSLNFTPQISDVAKRLQELGHEVIIPKTSEMILKGEITLEEIKKEKEQGGFVKRVIQQDSIRRYYEKIQATEAILVLNYDRQGIKNYIGGNTFLEIGFAHVLNKKIFLLNPTPEIEYYKIEIESTQPVILNGDLSRIIN